MAEIKACPFCKKTVAKIMRQSELYEMEVPESCDYYTVCCSFNQGGCGSTSGFRSTLEKAVEVWNMRDGVKEQIEKLEKGDKT